MVEEMHPTQKILVNPNTAFQIVDGEPALLDIDASHYFGLNETGTRIWQFIGENGEFRPLLGKMCEEFDVEPLRMEADLEQLIGQLAERGLVTLEPIDAETD